MWKVKLVIIAIFFFNNIFSQVQNENYVIYKNGQKFNISEEKKYLGLKLERGRTSSSFTYDKNFIYFIDDKGKQRKKLISNVKEIYYDDEKMVSLLLDSREKGLFKVLVSNEKYYLTQRRINYNTELSVYDFSNKLFVLKKEIIRRKRRKLKEVIDEITFFFSGNKNLQKEIESKINSGEYLITVKRPGN